MMTFCYFSIMVGFPLSYRQVKLRLGSLVHIKIGRIVEPIIIIVSVRRGGEERGDVG